MATKIPLRRGAVLIPCALAVLLCLRGLQEAVAHPDQMAFLSLFKPGKAPFNPAWFEKPPFHTYFNYFLSELPVSLLGLPSEEAYKWQTLWSKLLQVMLFAGTVAALYVIVRRMTGTAVAFAMAMLLATSAGMVAHAHFLTADIAVTFWMLLAFVFCPRFMEQGRWRDYALAGLLTGLAAATKYNGIGVGIAIPAAHLGRYLSQSPRESVLRGALDPKLILALALVPVGFVAANPFALFDFRTFYSDFTYNSAVAPVYEGQTGHSYGRFFVALSEAIGLPLLTLAGAGAVWFILRLRSGGLWGLAAVTALTAAAVLALYYAKFAPFPRLENRFVLPIAPYLLILAAPAFAQAHQRARTAFMVGVGCLLIYNVACCVIVGDRFLADPRVTTRSSLNGAIPSGASVEFDLYSAALFPRNFCCGTEMPFISGRERLFNRLFAGNEAITGPPEAQVLEERHVPWFTEPALAARRPDYVVTSNNFYGRFLEPGLRRDLYPSVRDYFSRLLAGRLGYRVVADLSAPPPPVWAYPQAIDFLDNRLVVLERAGPPRP